MTYDGILGYPFLTQFTVMINYRDAHILLAPHPTGQNRRRIVPDRIALT